MTRASKHDGSAGSRKGIQRIDYRGLIKTIGAVEQQQQQLQKADQQHQVEHSSNSPRGAPAVEQHPHHQNSPSHYNLSYHQQQQIHQQQIQRVGGLQRLTADLAGLQFNDAEALLRNLPIQHNRQISRSSRQPATGAAAAAAAAAAASMAPKSSGKSGNGTVAAAAEQLAAAGAAAAAAAAAVQQSVSRQTTPSPEQVQLARQQQQEDERSVSGSVGSDHDQIKDVHETNEDASILKRYKIISLVGTGNYARVYKAVAPNGREIAVKAINLNKTSENYKQKFLPRELTILRRVSHINICKIYEILQVADRIFIVMQFCSRGTIADLLQKSGPLSESLVRHLFAPTVDAIIYLHSFDVAHRDIKVENILLDQDYVPKLTDFSYSVYLSEKINMITNLNNPNTSAKNTTTCSTRFQKIPKSLGATKQAARFRLNETFCGTLPYLSPELIRQYPYDSKKTDIWSLGVCLYVMLNDRLPFPFNDIKLMIKKQLTKDYKFKANADISDACKDLVGQLLEPDFVKRLGSVDVSKHPWMSGPREKPKEH